MNERLDPKALLILTPNVGRNRRPWNGAAQLRDDFGRPR